MDHHEWFHFHTERRLVQLTGRSARTLAELLTAVRDTPGACVFYHTHHMFLSHHFVTPVVYNDFANWTGEALQESALAEELAGIDLLAFTTIRQLRDAIAATIERRLTATVGNARECPPGDEFHFCKSTSFVMPTGIVAFDVEDFFRRLPGITNVSLYFHFLEARLRLGRRTNDFSQWLHSRGESDLADAINSLDPYLVTLDGLKQQILDLGRAHGFG